MNLVVFTILFTGWLVFMADGSCQRTTQKYCCRHRGWWGGRRCVLWCTKVIWYCPDECRRHGKRSMPSSKDTSDFSCKFAAYDLNGNGKITYEEFVKSQKMKADDKENQLAFKRTDRNSDNVLTCEELRESQFKFECKLVCPSDQGQQDVEELIKSPEN